MIAGLIVIIALSSVILHVRRRHEDVDRLVTDGCSVVLQELSSGPIAGVSAIDLLERKLNARRPGLGTGQNVEFLLAHLAEANAVMSTTRGIELTYSGVRALRELERTGAIPKSVALSRRVVSGWMS